MTEWLELMLEEIRRKKSERAEADKEAVERARNRKADQDDPPSEDASRSSELP